MTGCAATRYARTVPRRDFKTPPSGLEMLVLLAAVVIVVGYAVLELSAR